MPDTFSKIIIVAAVSLPVSAMNLNTAHSPEALEVASRQDEVLRKIETSQALFKSRNDLISGLHQLSLDHKNNWDGNGALEINPFAVANAIKFIRCMPTRLPLPEICPEPDGCISLDWIKSRNQMLTISIGQQDRLAMAWVDGSRHGSEVIGFNGRNISGQIIRHIRETMYE